MNEKNIGRSLSSAGRYLYQEGTVYIILAVLVIFFAILKPSFLTGRNIYNLITQSTCIIIAGMLSCYSHPRTVEDVTAQIVGRILDQFDVEAPELYRWEGMTEAPESALSDQRRPSGKGFDATGGE